MEEPKIENNLAKCPMCGEEFIKRKSFQKYCENSTKYQNIASSGGSPCYYESQKRKMRAAYLRRKEKKEKENAEKV